MTAVRSMAIALFAALVVCVVAPSAASAEPARQVHVGVYLRDVTRFDQRNGTFDGDFEVWVKWLGEFDPASIRIANEASVTRDDLGHDDDAGWHVRRWRVRGTMRGEFPLNRFPFDDQVLAIVFELPERDAVLAPDLTGSGMESHFSITGWHYEPHFRPRTERLVYQSDLGSLAQEGRATGANRVRFEVTLNRPTVTIALKLFLPLVLILMVALIALFLPSDLIDARSAIGVTALLACFAFQFTVAGTIPDVAYLTIADALFIVAYIVAALALVETVVAYWLHRGRRDAAAARLDRAARAVLAIIAVVPAVAMMRPPPPPPRPAAPLPPRGSRERSARDVARVGVAQLGSLMTSVVTYGTRRGLVHDRPDGTRVAFLADREPAVGNDALRILSSGRFEVHWHLREGLRWSDGEPLTSDDVRFAYEVSPDPDVVAVATPDARSIVVTYVSTRSSGLDGIAPLPRHRLGDAFRRGGYDAVQAARRTQILPGAGPYRVVTFEPDRLVVLEPNPHFIGSPPSIRRVEVRCVSDRDALALAFERGELDILAPNALTPAQADALARRRPGVVLQRPSSTVYVLQPDPGVAWLRRRAVRVALLQAVERDALARSLFGEEGRAAHAPPPGDPPEGTQRVAFDPEAARATLAREGVAGQRLRLTHANGPIERQAARELVAAWSSVGLEVETREVGSVGALARERNHGGLLLQGIMVERETDPERFWNLPRVDGRFVRTARTEAYDDAVADLVDREARALFPERREQIRGRLYALFSERLPLLPLAHASERYVVTPTLRGWDRGPGVRFGEGLEQWYFGAPAPREPEPEPAREPAGADADAAPIDAAGDAVGASGPLGRGTDAAARRDARATPDDARRR